MLLFKNCEELSFQAKSAIFFLQMMQNNVSHPKLEIINYIIILIFSEEFSCLSKHAFMCRLLRTKFLDIVF